jgi:hypothetical protein
MFAIVAEWRPNHYLSPAGLPNVVGAWSAMHGN